MRKYNVQIGDVFKGWTVVKGTVYNNSLQRAYVCRCVCGTERLMTATILNGLRCPNNCNKCERKPKKLETINSGELEIPSYYSSIELSKSYFTKVRVRAKNSNILFNLSIEYMNTLFLEQRRCCALSGLELVLQKSNYSRSKGIGRMQTASLDRIDNTKGYVEGNVQWIHKDINFMKRTYSQEYFLQMCKKIAEHENNR